MYRLDIGEAAYSSWSLRGWLLLRAFGLPFETRALPMFTPEFVSFQEALAPGLKPTVPALSWVEGDEAVSLWDSLAIAETLAERHPAAGHWPAAPAARALARALAAEMHCGFAALRREAWMNTRAVAAAPTPLSEAARADVARIAALWAHARSRFGAGGPWLFGADFCAADAFYAPVAFRASTHRLPLPPEATAYAEALRAHPAVAEWVEMAARDPRRIERYEVV
ncbi:glutathione S-transferase [Rubrimonas cliftonensis]|uniref:Glutathione S-transferase n=1 Tax=Rubrimonas cliftonensis TaxID=89524 RepID=A0A1H3Z463_9RHOB|nr:glutathione S-transferase [Rubrimonas cliftonensis]SEA18643.1 glutathione S-transferase [Rubrimonas cliftonensis]